MSGAQWALTRAMTGAAVCGGVMQFVLTRDHLLASCHVLISRKCLSKIFASVGSIYGNIWIGAARLFTKPSSEGSADNTV